MDVGLTSLGLSFGAGLASVASPCVLPVVPLLVAGRADDHRTRPALVVAGIAASFVAMGVLTSLFGAAVGPALPRLEKIVGGIVVAFGLLLLADVNVFERLAFLQRLGGGGSGRWSGLLLGASLGLVWIPCVGPLLSAVLATVATQGSLAAGVVLLLAYALGFAVPMLALGYGSQALRQRVRAIAPALPWLEKGTGLLVVGFGILLLADVNLFKRLGWLQRIHVTGSGRWSGLLLGASLGLVWIPCVGPMLSSVLATVATEGSLLAGIVLLLVYSLGFAVPMLAVGYGSQALRQRIRAISSHPLAVRWASGLVLVAFGAVILKKGMLFIGM